MEREIVNIPCVTDRHVRGGFGTVDDMYLKNVGNEVANTILARYWKGIEGCNSNAVIVMEVRQIGNCMVSGKRENPNQGRVYDSEGLCPTITNMQGGADNL